MPISGDVLHPQPDMLSCRDEMCEFLSFSAHLGNLLDVLDCCSVLPTEDAVLLALSANGKLLEDAVRSMPRLVAAKSVPQ